MRLSVQFSNTVGVFSTTHNCTSFYTRIFTIALWLIFVSVLWAYQSMTNKRKTLIMMKWTIFQKKSLIFRCTKDRLKEWDTVPSGFYPTLQPAWWPSSVVQARWSCPSRQPAHWTLRDRLRCQVHGRLHCLVRNRLLGWVACLQTSAVIKWWWALRLGIILRPLCPKVDPIQPQKVPPKSHTGRPNKFRISM